ncbi:MAG: 2',3'-cyclic-nucleotide 2'-phosphodiesterase/3'-nucleotidase [Yoonia sp.]
MTQPARFDFWGREITPSASRIRHIALNGRAVAADDVFIVATNSFRASGGGGFAPIPQADLVWKTQDKLRDILIGSLQKRALIADASYPVWRFSAIVGPHAQFQTVSQAIQHAAHAITHDGLGKNGFETYSLAF